MKVLARLGTPGAVLLMAGLWILLNPEPVLAWGPGTHIALGEAVLSSLSLLPPSLRAILRRHRLAFLYGSVAADISFAKKYVPEGRHSHHWHVGEEILETADSEVLQATAYGYLAHLAADTVAHNLYVPRRLLLTGTTRALGHTYWEHRMDVHLGEDYLGKARKVVMDHEHDEADALFDRVLSRTLFSFRTNRRIFRGMIRIQDNEQWKQVFDHVLRNSRYILPEPTVDRYLVLSFERVMSYLAEGPISTVASQDPVGELNLRLAKKIRRRGLARGGVGDPSVLEEMAGNFFPFPDDPLRWWRRAVSETDSSAPLLPLTGPEARDGSGLPEEADSSGKEDPGTSGNQKGGSGPNPRPVNGD